MISVGRSADDIPRGLRVLAVALVGIGLGQCGGRHGRVTSPISCVDTATYILAEDYSPSWSPEGARVAFVHVSDAAVYIGDTLGTAPQLLVAGGQAPGLPPTELAWSPAADQLAMRYLGDIWTADVRTGSLHQWTHVASQFPHWPAWSPDGRYIAYSIISKPSGAPDSSWGLHVIDTVDGSDRAVLHAGASTQSSSRVAWSAALGGLVVSVPLTEQIDGVSQVVSDLFFVTLDGMLYQRMTTFHGKVGDPQLSPDGRQVLFDLVPRPCPNLESARETWVMGLDGSGVRKWSTNLADPTVTRSYPFEIARLSGRCVSVGRDSTGTRGVLIIQNLDGGGRRQLLP